MGTPLLENIYIFKLLFKDANAEFKNRPYYCTVLLDINSFSPYRIHN